MNYRYKFWPVLRNTQLLVLFSILISGLSAQESKPTLFERNLDAPFSYLRGNVRSWPIFDGPLSADTEVSLSAGVDTVSAG